MSSTRKAKSGKPPVSEAPAVISSPEERQRRAQKLKEIKAQIEAGTYRISAADVAKSIVRREITRLLGGKGPDKRRE